MGRKGFFLLALIFGLIAAGSAYYYLQSFNQVSSPELRPLVIAKTNIPARSKINSDQLTVKEVPLQGYPQGGAKTIQSVTGTVALVSLNPGDPVLEVMFQRQSWPGGIQSSTSPATTPLDNGKTLVVPEGKRAVSIPIGLVSGVGYAVNPGDHVDVLVTIDVKDSTSDKSQTTITTLAAQDVLVLSVGESSIVLKDKADSKTAESKFYTLALSVPQALTVTLGSEKGNLRLLLRNPVNKERRGDQSVTPNTFLDSNYFKRFE